MELFHLEFPSNNISLKIWCLLNDKSVNICINIEKWTIGLCLNACFFMDLDSTDGDFIWDLELAMLWGGQENLSAQHMVSLAR